MMSEVFDFKNPSFRTTETMESDMIYFLLKYPFLTAHDMAKKYHISSKYFVELLDKAFNYYFFIDDQGHTDAYFLNKFESEMIENDNIEKLNEDDWYNRLMGELREAVLNSQILNGHVRSWKTVWRRSPRSVRIINVEGRK